MIGWCAEHMRCTAGAGDVAVAVVPRRSSGCLRRRPRGPSPVGDKCPPGEATPASRVGGWVHASVAAAEDWGESFSLMCSVWDG